MDKVVVKGKSEPSGVYEVLDYHTDESFPNLREAVDQFQSGLAYYRKKNWDKATAAFGQALMINPNDALPRIYLERCEYMKAHPPEENWDGVWVLKSK